MDLKSIEINKVEFSVRISGQGRSFIWGHGLTSSMEGEDAQNIFRWNEFPKTIQLVRYDARGHGATAASKEPHHYHWRSLAEDMTAIADALHIDTFVAGGQSMGCATAIYAALKVPRRIEGLILVTPPTAWEKRKRMSDSYRKMAETSALLGGRLLAKSAIRGLINDPPDWLVGAPEEKLRSTTEGLNLPRHRGGPDSGGGLLGERPAPFVGSYRRCNCLPADALPGGGERRARPSGAHP